MTKVKNDQETNKTDKQTDNLSRAAVLEVHSGPVAGSCSVEFCGS